VNELIAWQGTVEILNATWSLDTGRTVELRLCGDAFDRVHPFKQFQKRRNGRVGTRFQAVFSRVDSGEQILNMEVMLAAWKDSSSIGQSITLWLDNEVETHPFCGCTRRKANQPGDVFVLVLVELNDDDTPINQTQRGNLERELQSPDGAGAQRGVHDRPGAAPGVQAPTAANQQAGGSPPAIPGGPGAGAGRAGQKPRRLSSSVHLLVTNPIFVRWLQETKGTLVKQWTPELARQYTKKVVQIESLADLDRDQAAVKRFNDEIRRPYERWKNQEP
jgi:hypothetical protein